MEHMVKRNSKVARRTVAVTKAPRHHFYGGLVVGAGN